MSALKGWKSIFKATSVKFGSLEEKVKDVYATFTGIGGDKSGLDVVPRYLTLIATSTLDVTPEPKFPTKILPITGHTLREGDVIRFTGVGALLGLEVQVEKILDANNVLLATTLPASPIPSEPFTQLRHVTPAVDSSGNITITAAQLSLVDELDNGLSDPAQGGILDTFTTNIPARSANAVQIVASLAANVSKMLISHDMGEFTAIYSDAARTNKLFNVPLTPDVEVDVFIPAGTALYLGNLKNAAITAPDLGSSSTLPINFLG